MKKNTTYRLLFWLLLVVLICTWGYMLFDKNKSAQQITVDQGAYKVHGEDSIQQYVDNLEAQLDSVETQNLAYKREFNIITPGDTIGASSERKRILRLNDSTNMVKDSINKVLNYMNDSIPLSSLSASEYVDYNKTLSILATIKIKMDLTLDRIRLNSLRTDTDQLGATITRLNNRRERLGKLSAKLQSVRKFIAGTIEVLNAAISRGLIISHSSV